MAKTLKDLTAQEILALAIQSEEEDGRIYADLTQRIRKDYPATARSLQVMREEEDGHRHRLISLYRERFGGDLLQIGAALTQRARYTIPGMGPCRNSPVGQTGL